LLFSAHLPNTYWADAVLTSCYLINRLPSRILDFKSPMEVLYNRKFNLSHLRTFGCICYVHAQNAGKLDPHAQKCVFVGYSTTQKGYRCYHPNSKRTYISRDVRFDEQRMFYTTEIQENLTTYKDFQIAAIPELHNPVEEMEEGKEPVVHSEANEPDADEDSNPM
jgi:hypothetical protein